MSRHDFVRDEEVEVISSTIRLAGRLRVPDHAKGQVVFAHGSGSSRNSPRNVAVAKVLNDAGFATLLFDLLTEAEASNRDNVFDIEMLARRLLDATIWLRSQDDFLESPFGYFGASTGAAAALWAAADPKSKVSAVVSRGGRADMAGSKLESVQAPTLLIVGELDDVVIDLNRQAQSKMHCENELVIIPGATHLFEEPGTLEQVANLARDWFLKYLLQ